MELYELAVLVRKESDLSAAKDLLEAAGAKIEKETTWGKKDLAYPISKETAAFYYFLDISLDSSKIKDLKNKMNFDEKILRYLLLKKD